MTPRRGLVTSAALAGAVLAVSAGVGIDQVVVPRLTSDSGPAASQIQDDPPQAAPGKTEAPGASSGEDRPAPVPSTPLEESTPRLKPLRGATPEPSTPSPSDGPDADAPGGGGGGGGAPAGASGPEAEVVTLTNRERAKAGCPALRVDQRLVLAARRHSADMAANDYFSHTSQNGDSPWTRMENAGYPNPGAENIAQGYATPAAVMEGWMNSSGHRANILNCGLRAIGVGVQTGAGGPWWTQNFGWV